MSSFLKESLRRFVRARDGNVTMIFALSAPMLIFGIAIAIDFTNATIVRSRLNAAADAASLAALTPAMMQLTDAQAQAAATAMFNARAKAIGSLVTGQTTVTVTITHPTTNGAQNMNTRVVSVEYWASTNTILGGVLGVNSMSVHNKSTSQATTPPNIDFYLLLDNSPSMSLPATTAGITQMQNLTPTQDGGNSCAFACHMAGTNNSDSAGNLCTDGSTPTIPNGTTPKQYCDTLRGKVQMDNYAMARYYNIPLRLDELTTGISTLMQTANSYRTSGIYATPPVYRFAAYSMDSLWQIGVTNTRIMQLTSDFINQWNINQSSFGVMEYYSNDNGCGNAACTFGGGPNDVATNYDNALSDILNTMPTPGNGTNQAGDKPQEVLFFVTDGVEDESYGGRIIQTINGGGGAGVDYCAQIKAKGIKIAILYTEYLPVPKNSFYQSNVAPILNNIGPKLQACASPNLYYDAAIGTNLGTALSTLFSIVAQEAALSN
jgi:Flp pilus assembly protein TadG